MNLRNLMRSSIVLIKQYPIKQKLQEQLEVLLILFSLYMNGIFTIGKPLYPTNFLFQIILIWVLSTLAKSFALLLNTSPIPFMISVGTLFRNIDVVSIDYQTNQFKSDNSHIPLKYCEIILKFGLSIMLLQKGIANQLSKSNQSTKIIFTFSVIALEFAVKLGGFYAIFHKQRHEVEYFWGLMILMTIISLGQSINYQWLKLKISTFGLVTFEKAREYSQQSDMIQLGFVVVMFAIFQQLCFYDRDNDRRQIYIPVSIFGGILVACFLSVLVFQHQIWNSYRKLVMIILSLTLLTIFTSSYVGIQGLGEIGCLFFGVMIQFQMNTIQDTKVFSSSTLSRNVNDQIMYFDQFRDMILNINSYFETLYFSVFGALIDLRSIKHEVIYHAVWIILSLYILKCLMTILLYKKTLKTKNELIKAVLFHISFSTKDYLQCGLIIAPVTFHLMDIEELENSHLQENLQMFEQFISFTFIEILSLHIIGDFIKKVLECSIKQNEGISEDDSEVNQSEIYDDYADYNQKSTRKLRDKSHNNSHIEGNKTSGRLNQQNNTPEPHQNQAKKQHQQLKGALPLNDNKSHPERKGKVSLIENPNLLLPGQNHNINHRRINFEERIQIAEDKQPEQTENQIQQLKQLQQELNVMILDIKDPFLQNQGFQKMIEMNKIIKKLNGWGQSPSKASSIPNTNTQNQKQKDNKDDVIVYDQRLKLKSLLSPNKKQDPIREEQDDLKQQDLKQLKNRIIDKEEFVAIVQKLDPGMQQENIEIIFNLIDSQKKNYITLEEFYKALN